MFSTKKAEKNLSSLWNNGQTIRGGFGKRKCLYACKKMVKKISPRNGEEN
jgi:hypothetical protein